MWPTLVGRTVLTWAAGSGDRQRVGGADDSPIVSAVDVDKPPVVRVVARAVQHDRLPDASELM
jgi:hypothetical protein